MLVPEFLLNETFFGRVFHVLVLADLFFMADRIVVILYALKLISLIDVNDLNDVLDVNDFAAAVVTLTDNSSKQLRACYH